MGNYNNGNKTDMAIIVIGFDGYYDLWDDYFTLLNKNWGDRIYPVYLANNTLKSEYKNVSVINCGVDAEWSKKARMAIEQVDEPYICLLLEDFYTGSKVDNNLITETLDFIKHNNIKYYKLKNLSKIKTKHFKNVKHLYNIPGNMSYGISLQPAIWEKDYLLKLLGDGNYNAWKFEYARVAESSKRSNKPLKGCVFDNRNILKIQHGVIQGKYIPAVVKYFKKQNYQLNVSKRTLMTKKEYWTYKFKLVGKQLIPTSYKETIKRQLSKFGVKYVSDKQICSKE